MADNQRHIFTSESVTEGHPDKMADQISDAVLDASKDDPTGRVACEVLVTTGICVVAGEITTNTYVDVPTLARQVIDDIGFTDAALRVRLQDLRRTERDSGAVAGHRDGRGHRRGRRSGADVWLCLRRNTGTHAAAHHAGSQADAPPQRRAQSGELDFLRPDGKVSGQCRVRRWQARSGSMRSSSRRSTTIAVSTEELREEVRKNDHRSRHSRQTWWMRTPNTTSTRLAVSSSAGLTVTRG